MSYIQLLLYHFIALVFQYYSDSLSNNSGEQLFFVITKIIFYLWWIILKRYVYQNHLDVFIT